MSDENTRPMPDDSTVPAESERLENEEKLNHLADEIGQSNWKDAAALTPRSQYQYNVVET
jgi:hypothetical protein